MDKNEITITVGSSEGGTTIIADSSVETVANEGETIAKYGVGRRCRGKVVNFKPYGFFVETENGGFGLVHGRNIKGWDWSQRFDRVFRHGSEVELTVIDIEEETNRMSFACEMPEELVAVANDAPEQEERGEAPAQVSRAEIARKWADENPEKSQAAYEWLRRELDEGPMFGPLTNVLCDRFDVPVPASRWILLFPDFICYSGRGDNPSDLPAVALSDRAGDVGYWKRIKVKSAEFSEVRQRDEDDTHRYGVFAKRLLEKGAFPGSRWIADLMSMARGLIRGRGVYGVTDTVERLAIPLLGQLGWDVSAENAALVRGGEGTFSIRLYGGTASSGEVSVAVVCAPAGTAFDSLRGVEDASAIARRDVVEQVLGLYNQLGGHAPASTRVIWTNGTEWVVFTSDLLAECIGVLAEHRGVAVMDELRDSPANCRRLRRVVFPIEGGLMGWLAAFIDLHDLIGKMK